MATCAEIGAQISRYEQTIVEGTNLANIANAAKNAINLEADIATARAKISQARSGLASLENAVKQLFDLADEAIFSNCPAQRELAVTLASQGNSLVGNIKNNIASAEAGIRQREEFNKAEEAAKKENNSGTGTPGTAGQGADATKPTTVVPAPVAGATGATGDGLGEVSVTGKRVPEPISPATDPDVKKINPETGEVYTTGERINPETGKPYTPVPATDPAAGNTNRGLSGAVKNTRAQATLQDTTNFKQRKDWRVRLALSPGAQQAKYLYWSDTPGILAPLQGTDGVIFPYTPAINVTYGASYNSVIPAHSNYKIFQYESSNVDSISITCDFTAQDTDEANYILAVIHFFRSVTKMFYGQDEFPKPGTPPPLCYLFGLGEFQFNAHPLAITNFTYSLPTDVDYIRAGAITLPPGSSRAPEADAKKPKKTNPFQALGERLAQNAVKKIGGVAGDILQKVIPGGKLAGPNFNGGQNSAGFNSTVPPGTKDPTYVPTKINISIAAVPIVSRYEVSNNFSVKDYASGKLLNGVKRAGGGFW